LRKTRLNGGTERKRIEEIQWIHLQGPYGVHADKKTEITTLPIYILRKHIRAVTRKGKGGKGGPEALTPGGVKKRLNRGRDQKHFRSGECPT